MGTPDQVRRQAERATELLDQLHNDPANPPADDPPAEPEVVNAPMETPVDPPDGGTPPPPEPVDPPPAPPAPSKDEASWEHKYKTLQGVLNAESGRWHAEKELLEARLRAAQQAPAATPAPTPAPTPQTDPALITDQDLETYGPDLMDVIGRKATEIASKIVAKRMEELKPELARTQEQVTNVASQVYKSSEDRFYGELAKAVPDWAEVNTDKRWLAWLGEVDPLSGVPRQAYLDNASKTLNHEHAARLFNAFKELAGLTKPAEPAPAPDPAPKPKAPSLSPRTVGQATAPTHREPAAGVTRSEIGAHYRRGATDPSYRDSTEHKEMEARIAKAMATGQVSET